MKKVVVSKTSKEKLEKYYCWVYKNEIVNDVTHIENGELVHIKGQNGEFFGIGYFNYNSEITIRIMSFTECDIDDTFFDTKIKNAIKKREHLKNITNAYRLIHSEADLLPGLIVDYYNGYVGIQINTLGMDKYKEIILKTLISTLSPIGIYDKSDTKVRTKEGITTTNGIVYGNVPNDIEINENGIKFVMSLIDGQKTGFYLDQRKNRYITSTYIHKNTNMLDIFCNAGGFGLYGLRNGANVTFVDLSANAISQVQQNLKLSNYENATVIKQDAFDYLTHEIETNNKYDMIVLDPPPFAKTKKESFGAIKGFKFLLSSAIKILNDDGYVAVFSCSHHISINELIDISLTASKNTNTMLEVVEILRADIDHAYILNIPNTNYLSGLILKKLNK